MFHDSRDQDVLPVADCVYFDFFSHQIFVYQNGVFLGDLIDNTDIFLYVLVAYRNSHALAAKYIGRTHQNRITQFVGRFFRLLRSKYGMSFRTGDSALFQNSVEKFSVLCGVYILRRSTHDLHTHFHQGFCQFDGCLSAELNDRSVRLFDIDDIFHVFRSQGLKVQLIRNVKVCADCLRIIVDDDRLISFLCESPGTVYGTEVKLDSLSDTDRSGTKNKYFLFIFCRHSLIFRIRAAVYRIVIRGGCRKLCRAGIYHFICGPDLIACSERLDLFFCTSAELTDHIIRKFHALRFQKKFSCQRLCLQSLLHLHKNGDLINKPAVDFCNTVDIFSGNISSYSFRDLPDTAVVHYRQLFDQLILVKSCKIIRHKAVHMLLQRTDRLHKRSLEIAADTHDLAGSLHLCGQRTFGRDKFVERQTRDFYHAVVKHRLKACIGFACNGVGDLIQRIAKSDLCSHLGDRISCCLAGKSRRTAYTGIYLDHAVFKTVRMERILHVASSRDSKLCDDIQR